MLIFSAVYFIVFMTAVVFGIKETHGRSIRYSQQKEPRPKRTNPKGKLKRTKGRNLLERLIKYKDAVLRRFAMEKEVPFTNNQAERDI